MTQQTQKCGFIAVVGHPNAGKSTLINALVGEKVAITSKRAGTTRCRILGIAIHNNAQMIFIDTPGIFGSTVDAQQTMERAMIGAAFEALDEADIALHLLDAKDKKSQAPILEKLPQNRPTFLALNKVDAIQKAALLDISAGHNETYDYDATFMISALKEKGLDGLMDTLAASLPDGPWHYDEDEVTDMPMRLMAAEITREQIFNRLHRELPYAALIETEKWENFDNGDVKIHQAIYVQRDSQKAIVLGKGGSQIKKIGEAARKELEGMLERRVHLKLHVKVCENWPDRPESLEIMGLAQH
ncbi:MAG: GTPase Era [Alphaproteobacteria bacterium]